MIWWLNFRSPIVFYLFPLWGIGWCTRCFMISAGLLLLLYVQGINCNVLSRQLVNLKINLTRKGPASGSQLGRRVGTRVVKIAMRPNSVQANWRLFEMGSLSAQ
ncbi:hypothetical protein BDV37DRAFT_249577, partial [Aspergillus pseudonomiae]